MKHSTLIIDSGIVINQKYRGENRHLYDGNILIKGNLGTIHFPRTFGATGNIEIERGTDINVTGSIYCQKTINSADGAIIATEDIYACENINAGKQIKTGHNLYAGRDITAKMFIISTGTMTSGRNINSEESVYAMQTLWARKTITGKHIRSQNDIHATEIHATNMISAGKEPQSTKPAIHRYIHARKISGTVTLGIVCLFRNGYDKDGP